MSDLTSIEGNPEIIPDDYNDDQETIEGNPEVPSEEISEVEQPSRIELSAEDIALGSRPPLRTLVILSAGPLISQLTQALYGLIDTMWIAKATYDRGVTAVSTYSNFDTIGRAFGFFLNVAASGKISSLFGAGLASDAPQVVADLIRIALICAVIVPAIIIPCLKPAAKWFNASDDITNYGYEYIFPVILCAFIPILYLLFCGLLQAEGRTWAFAGLQVSSLILNTCILDPLLMLGLRLEMFGNALATIGAEGIPCVVIIILYYCGKFSVKPKFRDLFKKFSPHTWGALKVGMSQLIYQLSLAIPGIVLRKFLGMCAKDDEMYVNIVAGFNSQIRFYQIVFAVSGAMTMGFLPCASYAHSAHRYQRVFKLLVHAFWIPTAYTTITMIFTVGIPETINKMFSTTPGYLYWGTKIVRNAFILSFISPVALIGQAFLQALQLGNQATVISVSTQLLPLPIFAAVLYYWKKDPAVLFYAYPIQQAIGVLVTIPMCLKPFLELYRESKNLPEIEMGITDGQPLSDLDGKDTENSAAREMERINDAVEV